MLTCNANQGTMEWNSECRNIFISLPHCNTSKALVKSVYKWMFLYKWLLYDLFWPFFCHMYAHLSQNWGCDGHFEVLNSTVVRPALWICGGKHCAFHIRSLPSNIYAKLPATGNFSLKQRVKTSKLVNFSHKF